MLESVFFFFLFVCFNPGDWTSGLLQCLTLCSLLSTSPALMLFLNASQTGTDAYQMMSTFVRVPYLTGLLNQFRVTIEDQLCKTDKWISCCHKAECSMPSGERQPGSKHCQQHRCRLGDRHTDSQSEQQLRLYELLQGYNRRQWLLRDFFHHSMCFL